MGQQCKGSGLVRFGLVYQKGISLNLDYFLERAKDSGDWHKNSTSEEEFKTLLANRIFSLNFDTAKKM